MNVMCGDLNLQLLYLMELAFLHVCLCACLEAVHKHDRYRRATDVEIRLKCAAFFTNARDHRDVRASARRKQYNLAPVDNSSDSNSNQE